VGLTSVQYLYINGNESTPGTTANLGINNNDVQIIGNQIPVTWKINKDLSLKVAPGFTFYTGGGNTNYDSGVPVNYGGSGTPTNQSYYYGTFNSSNDPVFVSPREADDLNVFSAPGEFDFKVANIPFRPYWDFDWNITGKQRVQNVYLNATGSQPNATGATVASVQNQNQALGDNVAWAAGLQIGQNKKKGDWALLGEFRQIGLGSVDPDINGTDFADSYMNQQGLKFSGVYNFTDFLTGTITFYDTWAYKSNLYQALGGSTVAAPKAIAADNGSTTANNGVSTQGLVAEKSLQRIQVDLGWDFGLTAAFVSPSLQQIHRIDVDRDADVVGPRAILEKRAQPRRDRDDPPRAQENLEPVIPAPTRILRATSSSPIPVRSGRIFRPM
jgi:hypothetical protein